MTRAHDEENGADRLIVIGGSAGGVEALVGVVQGLPPDLGAAVLVVLHGAGRLLPSVLAYAGALPAAEAADGAPLRPGQILVAAPGRHLTVGDGRARLVDGPHENHARPAIDPLFRSAAAYGPRAAGVVLSGSLEDGTRGLAALRAAGGLALVQEPLEAAFGALPRAALRHADPGGVLPAHRIARRLALWAAPAGATCGEA